MSFYDHNVFEGDTLYTLSRRIRNSAKPDNSRRRYGDVHILAVNLQYNMVKLMAGILYSARWQSPTLDDFEKILHAYNEENQVQLVKDDFFTREWIRIVNGCILFPSVISGLLFKIGYDMRQSKEVIIPEEYRQYIECLKLLYDQFDENAREPKLSKETLTGLLGEHNEPGVDIAFLVSHSIVSEIGDEYIIQIGNSFIEYFTNEITAVLWSRFGEGKASAHDFRQFVSILHKFEMFSEGNLWQQLEDKSLRRLRELAIDFILNEPDLSSPSAEVKKVYFDQHHQRHLGFTIPAVPDMEFKATEPYELLREAQDFEFYHTDLFDYQGVRTMFLLVLRLIIDLQTDYQHPYSEILILLKRCDKPFLVYMLVDEIQRSHPEIIPYLLNDPLLAPVAMNMVDTLSRSNQWLGGNIIKEDISKLRTEEIDFFWRAAFEHLLNLYSYRLSANYEMAARIFGSILQDQVERVFISHNTDNDFNRKVHLTQKKRYIDTLAMLRMKRLDSTGYHSVDRYVPMLLDGLLLPLIDVLQNKRQRVSKNEFIKFETATIYLFSDLLWIAEEIEINISDANASTAKLQKIQNDGYRYICQLLLEYFTIRIVTINPFPEKTTALAKRGINDFGIELINWGSLFLHFHRMGLLTKLNSAFKIELKFKKGATGYDDINVEQGTKLDYYVRILMYAFIDISKEANRYVYRGLPVLETKSQLQQLIMEYTSEYNGHEESEWKTDLFNERIKQTTFNYYRKPLFVLLYRALSFFSPQEQVRFLSSFFERSVNLLQMISAHNRLENKLARKWLAKKIEGIKVEAFIQSQASMTDIENALVEAVNSVDFFDTAQPLLEKVQSHSENVKKWGLDNAGFIYRIRLYQAFRKKDMALLDSIEEPVNNYVNEVYLATEKNLKFYYRALHDIYHLSSYDAAIESLASLSSRYPKNADYAFHLYRARIYKAIAQ